MAFLIFRCQVSGFTKKKRRMLKPEHWTLKPQSGSEFFTGNLLHRKWLLSNDFLLLCWYIGGIVFSTCKSISLCRRYKVDYFYRWKMSALLAECKVEIEIPLDPHIRRAHVEPLYERGMLLNLSRHVPPFDKGGLGGILKLIWPWLLLQIARYGNTTTWVWHIDQNHPGVGADYLLPWV